MNTVITGNVAVADARLSYELVGSGPPLVLIHGSLLDRRLWDDQVPALAARHTVLRYDARGHGASSSAVVPYAHHRDLYALLHSLGIARTAVLGLSMGGRVALHLALAYPDAVAALVLAGTASAGATVTPEMVTGRADYAAALARGAPDEAAEHFLRLWVDGPRRAPEQLSSRVREHARAMARTALAHPSLDGLDEAYDLPTPAQLRTIDVPTLVLVGDHDLAYMIESADLIAGHISGAERATLAGAGHLANLEQPRAFNDAVLAFLGRRASTQAPFDPSSGRRPAGSAQ